MYNLYLDFGHKNKKIIILKDDEKQLDQLVFTDDNSISAVETILKRNKLTIDNIKFSDFNQNAKSFTGARLSSAISNVINLANGKLTNYLDIKLPIYSAEPNLTFSSKNS